MKNGQTSRLNTAVARASGMVSVQAGCSTEEAVALMRDRAAVRGETLEQVAERVLDRTIRFI